MPRITVTLSDAAKEWVEAEAEARKCPQSDVLADLVERQVDVRTMMAVGGWSDYSAIEPYLAEPTETRIGQAMRG